MNSKAKGFYYIEPTINFGYYRSTLDERIEVLFGPEFNANHKPSGCKTEVYPDSQTA